MECPPSRIRTMSGQESRASGTARPPSEEGQLDSRIVAEVLAALAYGEQRGARRSQPSVGLAPAGRSKTEQQAVAARERRNWERVEARFSEVGDGTLDEPSR